jgi:hypothetical protein
MQLVVLCWVCRRTYRESVVDRGSMDDAMPLTTAEATEALSSLSKSPATGLPMGELL